MRKIISFVLVGIALNSFVAGLLLRISNIQALRAPDGYPLDPEWLILGLLIALPLLTGFLAFWIWPEEEKEEDFYSYSLYVGKSKNLLN